MSAPLFFVRVAVRALVKPTAQDTERVRPVWAFSPGGPDEDHDWLLVTGDDGRLTYVNPLACEPFSSAEVRRCEGRAAFDAQGLNWFTHSACPERGYAVSGDHCAVCLRATAAAQAAFEAWRYGDSEEVSRADA